MSGSSRYVVPMCNTITVTGDAHITEVENKALFRATPGSPAKLGPFALPRTFDVQPYGPGVTVVIAETDPAGLQASGAVIMINLPAADPHVVGQLYTSAGVVKQSAG